MIKSLQLSFAHIFPSTLQLPKRPQFLVILLSTGGIVIQVASSIVILSIECLTIIVTNLGKEATLAWFWKINRPSGLPTYSLKQFFSYSGMR